MKHDMRVATALRAVSAGPVLGWGESPRTYRHGPQRRGYTRAA